VFQKISKSRQRPTTAYQVRQTKAQSKSKSKMFSWFRGDATQQSKPRSSLFTTIRASQVLNQGAAGNARSQPNNETLSRDVGGGSGEVQVRVFEDYDAGMDDEISCSIGDIIVVKEEYDDGMLLLT
jgi:hypothetical protein